MILYQLRCSKTHEFEAWFRDSATYDLQVASGDVVCPYCGDTHVSKAIMAPHISTSRSKGNPEMNLEQAESRATEVAEQILEAVSALRSHVVENCDDVGDQFAEEAKRIHFGEVEDRGIYGQATDEEAIELDEEGIEFFRLPNVTRRDN